MAEYKICVIGCGGVGKSCLTIQYTQQYFVDEYDPTLEESHRKAVTIDNETSVLHILDTAGQNDCTAMRDSYMRKTLGFLFVYSISDRSSFDQLPLLYEQLLRTKDTNFFPIVVVGNKSDLEHDREITKYEGQEIARQFNGCPFYETSAKYATNVEEAFGELVREIRKDELGKAYGNYRTNKSECMIS